MLAAHKPIRVISLDYDACLSTPVTIAASTLRLVSQLLEAQYQAESPETTLLSRYKAHLEKLLRDHVSDGPGGKKSANEEAIIKGLTTFKRSLSPQDLATLKGILKSSEAVNLNIDVSDIIIQYQRNFIDILRSDSEQYSQTIVFLGSNRQSEFIDKTMAHNRDLLYRGQALQVVPNIAREIGAAYDPLLLGNIFPGDAAKGVMDQDKILIIYYQIQKAASEHPGVPIDYQFYDDTFRKTHLEAEAEAERGLIAGTNICPDLFPKGSTVHLRLHDESTRNAEKTVIVKDQITIAGQGPVDSHYAQTLSEIIERSPLQISKDAPPVRAISVGRRGEDLSPEALRQMIDERNLQNLVGEGRVEALQEAVLNQFARYLKAESTSNTEQFKAFIQLFGVLSSPEPYEVKAKALADLCKKSEALRKICSKIYQALGPLEASSIQPSRGAAGGAGSNAAVFAGAAGVASPARRLITDAEKVMRVINHIVTHLAAGEISDLSSRENIVLNGQNHKVPNGIVRIYAIALSDAPAAKKLAEIDAVLVEKALSQPWFGRRSEATTQTYARLKMLVSSASAPAAKPSITPGNR